jgi:hypothetical protein
MRFEYALFFNVKNTISWPFGQNMVFLTPRDFAQGASLTSLQSEFQGNYSCPVRAAWLVAFEFISCSYHLFSELTRNLHRFPTFKAGTFRVLAIVSKVFQCIPSNEAVSRRSSSCSNALNLDLSE